MSHVRTEADAEKDQSPIKETAMHNLNTSDIENICRKLKSAFQGVLSWRWEDRFETVLAQIRMEKKESVREVLERDLMTVWNSTNITTAPETVQAVIRQLGGLMAGQMLFTSDPSKDAFIFCAWWPWGDGETISVRIAPAFRNGSDSESGELMQQFKSWLEV